MSNTANGILTIPDEAAPVARVRDYLDLLKPRVMSLVVFTGWIGVMIAPGHIHPFTAALAVLAIALGSGAAGAINMWYERDLDAVMERTRKRPLPSGRVAPDDALGLGVLLSIFSVALMAVATNFTAAALLAAAILFYVFVYTIWLKRRTPQNIVIGGAAGAFPPMIGWAAVTGDVSAVGIALFLLVFLWTPPHFWALALYRCDDYRRAGVPMLPVVAGPRETKRQMLAYTVLLVPVALAPTLLGSVGWLYGSVALAMSLAFLGHALAVWRTADDETAHGAARRMFRFSLLYLAALFAALPVDLVVHRFLVG
ncbi:MAG: heme o synthase [Reyranella sp.]|jgi:protoheme IX farnesyltransferase|uniref:heme o synthase n=1 Tax=Reyranella sp. TaxID=1929291 RepID=UPI00095DBAB2|nr:heme o synthase [Reyranella sp.]MBN9540740.1 heme o synthase [Alphaproteobacteria bacterium]MBR2818766.1 heme o synthase [Reyranella sp.]OJU41622.1 MAG: protoheme IX farnesyltransferase [Alphaproteobacteria bacterium 65-37]